MRKCIKKCGVNGLSGTQEKNSLQLEVKAMLPARETRQGWWGSDRLQSHPEGAHLPLSVEFRLAEGAPQGTREGSQALVI